MYSRHFVGLRSFLYLDFLILSESKDLLTLSIVDTSYWQKISPILLLISFFLLAIILIPGVGRSVNGSIRWVGIGPFGIQVSELAKLALILYFSFQ